MKYILLLLFVLSTSQVWADAYEDMLSAIKKEDVAKVEALFSRGMDPNTTDETGNSLLMLAARENSIELLRRILARQPKVKAKNGYGETALMFAASRGNIPAVQLLIEAGGEVNHPGWNPLIYAAWQGKTDMVKFLLGKGAAIDALGPNGTSALMMAARGGHADTVKLLVWETANPNFKNDSGATALSWAEKSGSSAIVDLLKQAGAKE